MKTALESRIGRRLQGAKLDEVKGISSSLREAAQSLDGVIAWAQEGDGDPEENGNRRHLERRAFRLDQIGVEKREDGSSIIRGHAAVFNELSEDFGNWRERILPGAFTKTLKEADVRSLFNHDSNLILGRTKSGTLRLQEDETGLVFEVDPPDTTYANDLLVSIGRGDIDQASFAFQVVKDRMSTNAEETVRELLEVRLFDVSPVTFPAYPQTDVSLRDALTAAGEALRRSLEIFQGEAEKRGPTPFQDLPLADRERPWDGPGATQGVQTWASSDGSGDKDTIDWAKLRKAFFWYDAENAENLGSYKLIFADVIDGELTAVPRGIFAGAVVLQGGRTGVDIPEADMDGVKSHVSRYYAKMRDAFGDDGIVAPWEQGSADADAQSRAGAHSAAGGGNEPGGRPLAMLRRELEMAEKRLI